MGTLISLPAGRTSGHAYVASPPTGQGPGVLLLHAWWGLTSEFKGLVDRMAREGFLVLAPDYYQGHTAGTVEEATKLRSTMDRKAVHAMIRKATDYLVTLPELAGSHIAAVGFSLGCSFAVEIARARAQVVDAVVLFYGTGSGKLDKVNARFLGHFAEHDQWGADAKKVRSLEERLRSAGLDYEFHTYPGTGHWFFAQDRPEAFNAQAAEQAWRRTVDFLSRRLT
jgi:carboxymethylenebutenolidase